MEIKFIIIRNRFPIIGYWFSIIIKEFFKQNLILNAQIFLNSIFEEENLDISVSSALTSSLLNGSVLWKDCLTPSGLASSVEGVSCFIILLLVPCLSLDICRCYTLYLLYVFIINSHHYLCPNGAAVVNVLWSIFIVAEYCVQIDMI